MKDPLHDRTVTGPFTSLELAALAMLPFGEATKKIREHDPLWGRREGEMIRWKVKCARDSTEGVAYVEAATEEEANELAGDLCGAEIDWDDDGYYLEIVSVEVAPVDARHCR